MDENLNDNQDVQLSEQEIWDFIQFARSLNSLTGMPLTPELVNARLKDISITSSVGDVTEAQVKTVMSNPKDNEQELLRISESLEISSTLYRRLLHYMAGLLSFDLTYYAKNVSKPEEYKSRAYQKDLDVLKKFLDAFDYKSQFSTVVKQLLREETFFCVLRDEGQKFILQQLPSDYCKIDGRFDHGLLYSFNYNWFRQGGVAIDMYPPIFARTYEELYKGGNLTNYNPTLPIDYRGNSMFVFWVDCSPADGFWAWKMSPELIARLPYFMGMFSDLVLQTSIRTIQKNSYLAQAVKFILGEVALLNKDQKATVKDAISISPDLLGKFMSLIKAAVNSDSVRIATAPLQNMQGVEFEGNTDIYSTYLRNTVGSSGINSNLLFSADTKPNLIETQLSADVDLLVMQYLYPSFSNFIEFFVNRQTSKYKFGIQFEGSSTYLDRQRRLETQTTLMAQGIVNPQKIAAALGQNPFVFQRQLDEARMSGWVDNLTPIIPAAQMSGKETSGRPAKKDDELTDAGEQTRSSGENIARGGKV